MAEEKNGKGKSQQQSPPSGKGSPIITEDWEAAFRAEDYLCSAEEEGATIPAAPDLGDISVPSVEGGAKIPRGRRGDGRFATLLSKLPTMPRLWRGLPSFPDVWDLLLRRWKTLSRVRRLQSVGVGLAVLLVAGGGIFLHGTRTTVPPVAAPVDGLAVPTGDVAEPPVGRTAPPPEVSIHKEESIESGEEAPIRGKQRWPLAAFLIAATPESGNSAPVLVNVELTLVAAEGENGELQSDHIARVRDIIYQFFANRPLSELRRYSIDRGDMKRDLLAWIKKQWPAAAVETVQVNRYQLS